MVLDFTGVEKGSYKFFIDVKIALWCCCQIFMNPVVCSTGILVRAWRVFENQQDSGR